MKKFICTLFLIFTMAVLHAQTTYTLDPSNPSYLGNQVNFHATMNNGMLPIWIDLAPWSNPTSSAFIEGIPGFTNGWAQVQPGPTYQVTYTTASFTTRDGVVHTGKVPKTLVMTFIQVVINPNGGTEYPPNPLIGSATIQLGNYTFVEGAYRCGACDGWHWSIVGGYVNVGSTGATAAVRPNVPDIFIGGGGVKYFNCDLFDIKTSYVYPYVWYGWVCNTTPVYNPEEGVWVWAPVLWGNPDTWN